MLRGDEMKVIEFELGLYSFMISAVMVFFYYSSFVSYTMKLNDSHGEKSVIKKLGKIGICALVFVLIFLSKNYVIYSNKTSLPQAHENYEKQGSPETSETFHDKTDLNETSLQYKNTEEKEGTIEEKDEKYLTKEHSNRYIFSGSIVDSDNKAMKSRVDLDKAGEKENDNSFTISISVAGDTTLGYDSKYGYEYSFMHEFDKQDGDFGYFLEDVKEVFKDSEISMVNLEGVLSDDGSNRAQKKFNFRGPKKFSQILTEGNVDAVNLANNHTFDFGERGYKDTMMALESEDIEYFGNGKTFTEEINGIDIKMLGFTGWSGDYYYNRTHIKEDIEAADEKADIVIVSYHWGEERVYYPNYYQQELGRLSVESGADLVWGHHPHVLQGIEEYQGANIVYSLGNFSFGGNRNPEDKDSMIYQHVFEIESDEVVDSYYEIIPIRISSIEERNDFRPTILKGEEGNRIVDKVIDLSRGLN